MQRRYTLRQNSKDYANRHLKIPGEGKIPALTPMQYRQTAVNIDVSFFPH